MLEEARKAAEVQAWAEEEAQRQEEEWCAHEEEEDPVVERDLREEGGPSWERAPWRWLFRPSSSDSARSPEEEGMEVRVEGPSRNKGKGRAPVSEEAWGEVTGVVCDLCDKKGIPCRWGKVSDLSIFCIVY